MISSRRLENRSLLGLQVCAPHEDGFYHNGAIEAVKSRPSGEITFTIIFDNGHIAEVDEKKVIGPGFRSLGQQHLKCGQRVYIRHEGREVAANVVKNRAEFNEVLVQIPYQRGSVVAVRPDELSLLKECRAFERLEENSADSVCPVPCKIKAHGSSPCKWVKCVLSPQLRRGVVFFVLLCQSPNMC